MIPDVYIKFRGNAYWMDAFSLSTCPVNGDGTIGFHPDETCTVVYDDVVDDAKLLRVWRALITLI